MRSTLTLLQIWSQVFPRVHWSLWRRNAVFQFLSVAASFWSSFFLKGPLWNSSASIAFFELANHHLLRTLSETIRIPQWTQNCLYETKNLHYKVTEFEHHQTHRIQRFSLFTYLCLKTVYGSANNSIIHVCLWVETDQNLFILDTPWHPPNCMGRYQKLPCQTTTVTPVVLKCLFQLEQKILQSLNSVSWN